ncbi:ribonuclease p/mrp subunit [Fonsecaea pedrosoi]|nr:ribonuclease p/mrp subunit [Fonsecaea pedrosoi]
MARPAPPRKASSTTKADKVKLPLEADLIKANMTMTTVEALVTATGAYFAWATVVSDSLFHRVWGLALGLLEFSVLILPQLWPSWSAYSLILFIVVDFVFCVALSPLQPLIFPASPRHPTFPSVEEIHPPKTESVNSESPPIVADVVAVHGLGSNPTTTWQPRPSSPAGPTVSWPRDLLPKENLNIRVLVCNHNTRWDTGAINKSLQHYGDDLLRGLRRVRQRKEDWDRPLVFIGHSFGGLIIKQMLVNAAADTTDEFCQAVLKNTKGFIFLGTPHKGANLTFFGRVMSLFGYWTGASTSLLEVVQPNSNLNESLHRSFMRYLGGHCGPQNTVCVFETVAEAIFGISVTQVVDRNSAVIDGSREIGFEKGHLDIQRFASADDENFRDLVQWIKKWTDNGGCPSRPAVSSKC